MIPCSKVAEETAHLAFDITSQLLNIFYVPPQQQSQTMVFAKVGQYISEWPGPTSPAAYGFSKCMTENADIYLHCSHFSAATWHAAADREVGCRLQQLQ